MALRNVPVKKLVIPSEMKVQLSDAEDQICRLLDEYVESTQNPCTRTVCRIAGGWVRDKLLGFQSNDIDIALSNMMGLVFAEGLSAYARDKGVPFGTISKIAQNPDQSKHLETATFKVFGLDIDLVNLRSEEYASDSRIPTGVSFGTPHQDALRRDITINALFYNVHSREVEDFTGQGRKDLQNGVIRTPLPPRETFLDDPLRVLRCIRFASRFGFDILPGIEEAARDATIQKALVSKVARERVGEELSKMMKGHNQLRSIELIYDLSLYTPIFFVIPEVVASTLSGGPVAPSAGLAAASILYHILENMEESRLPDIHPLFCQAVQNDSTCTPRLYLAASLTPYKNLTYRDKKKREKLLIELIIRDSLKLGTQYNFLDGIPLLFTAADIIRSSIPEPQKLHPSERVGIGLLLRNKSVHKPEAGSHWTSSFLFSLVQELVDCYDTGNGILKCEQATGIINKYNQFAQKVEDLSLQDACEMKPLLNGFQLIAALEARKPGQWLGKVLNNDLIEWQLEHPMGGMSDCIQWLKERKGAGHIQVDDTYKSKSYQ